MNAVIKSSDMTPEMTTFAVQQAKGGLKKFCTENVRACVRTRLDLLSPA